MRINHSISTTVDILIEAQDSNNNLEAATVSQSVALADDIIYEAKDVFKLVSCSKETTAGFFLSCSINRLKMADKNQFWFQNNFYYSI